MGEYRLAPAAERHLENIWLYTRQQWGVEQARRYIDTLTAVFVGLAQPQERPGLRSHPCRLSPPQR